MTNSPPSTRRGRQAAYQHIVPPELPATRSVDARERDFVEPPSGRGDGHDISVSEQESEVVGFAYTRAGLDTDLDRPGEPQGLLLCYRGVAGRA